MQFETSLSMCVCVCVCPCVYMCGSVGGEGCLSQGEVAVKSVLFSPVGWICSLQICTACYCNRSHSCCSRCSRLQRRVCTEPEQADLSTVLSAASLSPFTISRIALSPWGPASLALSRACSSWLLPHSTQASSCTCSLVLSLFWLL